MTENDLHKKLNQVTDSSSSRTDFQLSAASDLNYILNFPKIHIKEIPDGFNIHDSTLFITLLDTFNKTHNSSCTLIDMLTSKSKYTAFKNFMLVNALIGNIQVDKSQIKKLIKFFDDLETTYKQQLRSVDRYYDEIIDLLYRKKGKSSLDVSVIKEMYAFQSAYTLMKQAFQHVERETVDENNKKDRYFKHLKGTMEIVMNELPHPNMDKIVIALLHDVIEDIPGYTKETLRTLYGEKIANGVAMLSKKDWREYLKEYRPEYESILQKKGEWEMELKTAEQKNNVEPDISGEQEEYINKIKLKIISLNAKEKRLMLIAKERRDIDYFGHLGEIEDQDVLDVKFADRINNLRTMNPKNINKIAKKVEETIKYFLPVAKPKPEPTDRKETEEEKKKRTRNEVAYNLMKEEVDSLIKDYKLENILK